MSGHDAFEGIVAALNYPVFVVTTREDRDGGELSGCLVGFASQTSINPPRFLVGLSKKNRTFRIAQDSTHLVVHVLPRKHMATAELFGGATGDDTDKFSQCGWDAGPMGLPILRDAEAWFVGRIVERFNVGDHVAHLLEPTHGDASNMSTDWVRFGDVRDIEPGHEA